MAPTLFAYDSFSNVVKETLLLDAESPDNPAKNPITAYAYAIEQRDDGIYRITTTTKNNNAGTTYTESTAVLLTESAVIEQKTVATDPRGNTATTWTEYGTGSQRTQKNVLPTSNITATATVIDGFATVQTDPCGRYDRANARLHGHGHHADPNRRTRKRHHDEDRHRRAHHFRHRRGGQHNHHRLQPLL